MYLYFFFQPRHLEMEGGQRHAPAALSPGKTRYRLYRRLGGTQGRSGRVRKVSPSTVIRSPARSQSLCNPGQRDTHRHCTYI